MFNTSTQHVLFFNISYFSPVQDKNAASLHILNSHLEDQNTNGEMSAEAATAAVITTEPAGAAGVITVAVMILLVVIPLMLHVKVCDSNIMVFLTDISTGILH